MKRFQRHVRWISYVLCVLFVVALVSCSKPAGPIVSDTSDITSQEGGGAANPAETGFYDDAGNFYAYFDDDGDNQWDGFMDPNGNKFFYFDEDTDGEIDGYYDAEGKRYYYDLSKETGDSSTNVITPGASTQKPESKNTANSTPSKQTPPKSSAELYKNVKGTTVNIMFAGPIDSLSKKAIKAFELAYGCKVTTRIVAWNDFKNQFQAMVAANNVPDNCGMPDETFLKWVSRGLVQPMDPYVNPTDPLWSGAVWDASLWKGKHYGVSGSDGSGFYCIYNASLFKAKGVKTPMEYYKEGTWNFANFKKVCAFMTYGDVVGCGISWRYMLHLSNGSTVITIDRDKGTVVNGLGEAAAVTATEDVVNLYRDKYISFEAPFEPFGNAKMAMVLERPWNIIGQFDLRNTTLKNAVIEICPLPKGPNAKEEYLPSTFNFSGIPTKAKNPLGAAAWFYFGIQYGNAHKNDADVIANRRLTYTAEQEAFITEYEKTHKRIATFVYGVGNWAQDDWGYWHSMITDGLSVQAANDKFAGEFKGFIDTLSNG